ncbi:MAG: ATP-binding protein [Chloroflexota bacterium]|nr:ATP-binding protein [Chloroflexota bacterium]
MIITVASGKGGTGKTTVAVSLALSIAVDHRTPTDDRTDPLLSYSPLFLDCDVEEPNAALFLRPIIQERREVGQMIPKVDLEKCTYCGRCAEVCQYHAIAVVGEKVLVFPELCHGCGSCSLNCPTEAIHEALDVIGTIERGWAGLPPALGESAQRLLQRPGRIEFAQGTMNVGEPMAVPIIRQLKKWVIPPDVSMARLNPKSGLGGTPSDRPVILDASPGAACPVVESMRGADFVLMVTEPTPFGLHDLRLAVEVARDELGLPVGVVINRDGVGDQGVDDYCAAESIPILMRIPLDRRIAEAYSDGGTLVEALPEYREQFQNLHAAIGRLVADRKGRNA